MYEIILTPFSWLLTVFHDFFNSYGVALILFAIIVKAILFPFSLKGKRSTIQQTLIQDKVQKIQKQYANNRTKMNEELQALYAKENVKPMSGCLWNMVPLLVLWPLYSIIRRPMSYMMHLSSEAIWAIAQALGADAEAVLGLTESTVSSGYNELKLAGLLNADNIETARSAVEAAVSGEGSSLFQINFNFLGLDLSQIPQWKFWAEGSFTWGYIGLVLLPLVSAALALVMSIVSQKTNRMNNTAANSQMTSQMRTMMLISPLLSLWIGFAMPAALCVYWIINNLLSIVQELISGKMLKKDYERAAQRRAEQEQREKEEEKRRKQEAAERKRRAMEQAKQNKGKKKKKGPVKKPDQPSNEASREGMRRYARGRSYDPNRYGGVTPYQDPGAPIDEEAVEKARQAKEEQELAARTKEAMRKFEEGLDLEPEEQELVDAALLQQAEQTLEEQEDGEEAPPAQLPEAETADAPEDEEADGEEKSDEDEEEEPDDESEEEV
ncbi:MAG: membrane protein insertase YidC [Oscillospiraceae bacterium]|nr:membrane protein insertase YidC [Oscillospiraceae bacterium]